MVTFANGPHQRGRRPPLPASQVRRTTGDASGLLSVWVVIWVGLLGRMLYLYFAIREHPPTALENERIMLVEIWMLVLSFPCGLLWVLVGGGLVFVLPPHLYSIVAARSVFSLVVDWLGLFVCSYVQWWMVVPWIVGRFRQRRRSKEAEQNPE